MVPKVLFAPDYGVPQLRRRVFFGGMKDSDMEFEFPQSIVDESHYVTCEQAISDLPGFQLENGEYYPGK